MFKELKSYKKLQKLSQGPIDLTKNLKVKRIKEMTVENLNFKLLFATERIDQTVLDALFDLAKESSAIDKMKDMQSGKIINCFNFQKAENRQVLHTAMRDVFENPASLEAKKAKEEILKLENFLKHIDKQDKFTTLVQIGIGGSFLGPKALYESLKKYSIKKRKAYFISNVDPDDAFSILDDVDLSRTLFVSVSKSGTTLETLTNEELVKAKLKEKGLNPKDHIVSVTGKNSPMDDPSKYLESFYIWEYVGGRFSATSMIGGVTLGFAFGIETFKDILKGANAMDKVALQNQMNNLPLLSALIGIWNRNFLNYPAQAIIPYSQALLYFPLHLQQLDMESNGKSINKDGKFVTYKTGPIIFGDVGTNAQHSFFQLLHQGTDIVPVEFVGFKHSQYNKDIKIKDTTSQAKLLSNLFAQSLALAQGSKNEDPNKNFSGNRPNHILFGNKLDPYNMGVLLAYFEHKVAFQGFIWDINSFDQEGVQLGKKLANKFLDLFAEKEIEFDLGKEFIKMLL